MPAISDAQLTRMRDELLFSGADAGRKLSRFWVLLVLAAVIATAGVIADSTATVIGAMIVAPLMTPILGTVLSIVTGDRLELARSLGLVVVGAVLVVAIAYLMGLAEPVAVVAETDPQVAGRVHPRLIDLVAALATGAVGSFALVRADVSDTLPGVAIAISLVPPLAVVGLTLESGAPHQAAGALLLFLTNVGAILLSGLVVMAIYRVTAAAERDAEQPALRRHRAVVAVVVFVIALAIPLSIAARQSTLESRRLDTTEEVATAWADPVDWRILAVDADTGTIRVRTAGELPAPEVADLRAALDDTGLVGVDVVVELVPERRIELPASR
jgi:uncharacterized hydrophobic protein (TIGR00271 family)